MNISIPIASYILQHANNSPALTCGVEPSVTQFRSTGQHVQPPQLRIIAGRQGLEVRLQTLQQTPGEGREGGGEGETDKGAGVGLKDALGEWWSDPLQGDIRPNLQ